MTGGDGAGAPLPRTPALHAVRRAVQAWHRSHGAPPAVTVALSGGGDSLALLAGTLAAGLDCRALIVDHGLQPGSADVAATARARAAHLGCTDARVIGVRVGTVGGPEAAARDARYAALDAHRAGTPVLLAHTLDDQAETVLLGLGRGSGARSLAGMAAWSAPYGRPLLAVRRAVTARACAELALAPHHDPHNDDPRFTRVRLRREVLPLLEEVLGGGVAPALARTAAALRVDNAALDDWAARVRPAGDAEDLPVAMIAGLPTGVRTRVLRSWLADTGARAVTSVHLSEVDRLVTDWHGQGPVAVPGRVPGHRHLVHRGGGILYCGAHRDQPEGNST